MTPTKKTKRRMCHSIGPLAKANDANLSPAYQLGRSARASGQQDTTTPQDNKPKVRGVVIRRLCLKSTMRLYKQGAGIPYMYPKTPMYLRSTSSFDHFITHATQLITTRTIPSSSDAARQPPSRPRSQAAVARVSCVHSHASPLFHRQTAASKPLS